MQHFKIENNVPQATTKFVVYLRVLVGGPSEAAMLKTQPKRVQRYVAERSLKARRNAIERYVAQRGGKIIAPPFVGIEPAEMKDWEYEDIQAPGLSQAWVLCKQTGAELIVSKRAFHILAPV